MTDRAPWRRPMMFSRLSSAASTAVGGARLAAKAQAACPSTRRCRQVQRAVQRAQRERRGVGAAGVAAQRAGGSCPALSSVARRERGLASSSSAWPVTRQRPWPPLRRSGPAQVRRSVPPSCSVFHGVPRPASQAAGHWPIVGPRPAAAAPPARPRPGRISARTSPSQAAGLAHAQFERPGRARPSVQSSAAGQGTSRRGCRGRRSAPARRCRSRRCRARRPAAGAGSVAAATRSGQPGGRRKHDQRRPGHRRAGPPRPSAPPPCACAPRRPGPASIRQGRCPASVRRRRVRQTRQLSAIRGLAALGAAS